MKRLARLTATVVLGSLVLAGCGNDDDSGSTSGGKATSGSSASESTSESATESPSETTSESESGGPLEGDIVGKGYAFDLPDGWSDTTKKAKTLQATIDTAATEDNPSNGFADNLNVGYNNVGEATLDQLEATVPDQLKNLVKEGDLDVLPRTEIAGVEAIHHRAPAAARPDEVLPRAVRRDHRRGQPRDHHVLVRPRRARVRAQRRDLDRHRLVAVGLTLSGACTP